MEKGGKFWGKKKIDKKEKKELFYVKKIKTPKRVLYFSNPWGKPPGPKIIKSKKKLGSPWEKKFFKRKIMGKKKKYTYSKRKFF